MIPSRLVTLNYSDCDWLRVATVTIGYKWLGYIRYSVVIIGNIQGVLCRDVTGRVQG